MRHCIFLLAATAAFGAGSVNQTGIQAIGTSGNYALTFYWTGDALTGTVPVTLASLTANLQGLRILQIETVPGTPAPTNGYNIALTDSQGADLMSGALSGLSSVSAQFFAGNAGTPPLLGSFSLSITGQGVPSAKGAITIFIGPTALVSTTVGSAGPAGPAGPQGIPGVPGGAFNVALYNFTPQTPLVSLASGNNTISLAPMPLGVNGSDLYHRLYVSGGTGTAEACLITGGSGTAGSAGGQVIINCANTHTGAWTIQSIDKGIQEAAQAAETAGGGTVFCPAGLYTSYAALQLQSKVVLQGNQSCEIQAAAGLLNRNAQWQHGGASNLYYCMVCSVSGSTNVVIDGIIVDENGSTQPTVYISGDIELFDNVGSVVKNVTVQNRLIGITGVGVGVYNGSDPFTSNRNNVISNSAVLPPNGGGAYYIEGTSNQIINSYSYGATDSSFIITGNSDSMIGNRGDTGTATLPTPMYEVWGNNNVVDGNTCTRSGMTGQMNVCYQIGGSGIAAFTTTTGTVISNNTAANAADFGYELSDATGGAGGTIVDTVFSGNTANNCNAGFSLAIGINDKVSITGNHILNNLYAGINIVSPTAVVGAPNSNLVISGNIMNHNAIGVLVQSSQTVGVNNFILNGNIIEDTSGSPIMTRGIYFQSGNIVGLHMRDNIIKNSSTQNYTVAVTLTNSEIGPNITGDGFELVYNSSVGASVASASTITATGAIFHVTGTTTISGINTNQAQIQLGTCITLIPDGLWSTTTGGNIAIASTAVVSKALTECWDPGASRWYPSY